MSGMVGIFSKGQLDPDREGQLVAAMARDITYAASAQVDRWSNDYLAIARVHHGLLHAAPQPLFSQDGSLGIVIAGEVFGYEREKQALAERGHHFHGEDDDAEYCLHLYENYGLDAFPRLNGSFLLALYDVRAHELVLANDRFSSWPLFYYSDGQRLIFGTQLRPLLQWQDMPRRLDRQAVWQFFALQRVLGERTYYEDVRVLPPASVLRFDGEGLSSARYWQMRYKDAGLSEEEYVEALGEAFQTAVRTRTRGDHRLGILLSGGLDSRGVLAADREGRISVAFTLGEFENREVRLARQVAEAKGCRHVFIRRHPDHYVRLVNEAVDIGDGMSRFENAHFLGALGQMRQEADILFNGFFNGGPFKGERLLRKTYTVLGQTLSLPALAELSLDAVPETLLLRLKSSTLRAGAERLFRPVLREQRAECVRSLTEYLAEHGEAHGGSAHNAYDYITGGDFCFKLGVFLNLLCIRAHMHECTVLFDNDLFDLYLSLPPQFRLRGRVYRKMLTQTAPALAAIPYSVTGVPPNRSLWWEWFIVSSRGALRRTGVLPQQQFARPAHTNGSWPRMAEIIRHNEGLLRAMQETFHDPMSLDPALFDIEAVDACLAEHMSRQRDASDILSLLLTFGRWHRRYGPV